jgi:hypothetical protein
MKHLRLRSTGFLAALVLGALAMIPTTPNTVDAQTTCGPYKKVTFYAEPEMINVVGTCTTKCTTRYPSVCSGTMTAYYIVNWEFECPTCV